VTPSEHYQQARLRAHEVRKTYGLTTPRVMVNDLKNIYKDVGIVRVDYYDGFKSTRVRGAYFNDHVGCTVMVNKKLIKQTEPKVFTLAHELKHHLMDEVHAVSLCSDDNEHITAERAADVFAGELIYPTSMMLQKVESYGIFKGLCTPDDIVRLKHETQTTLSHLAIAIRLSRLGWATPESIKGIKWNNLRDSLYPEYAFFKQRR
jgi:Zn-dependent peptidase ImmA (M78 family)